MSVVPVQEMADACVLTMAEEHMATLVANAEGESANFSSGVLPIPTDGVWRQKKEKEGRRLWYGQAFGLDEAYEWLENLSLIGCPGEKSIATSINPHTSTLNTLIARGKTKRAARTSTSYEGKASQRVSFSVLGNGHPTRIIAMERNLEGQRTAATRERFMMCVNSSVARRDALPESMLVADPDLPAFTWLPLTTLQAAIFKREGVVNNPKYFANSVAESQDADQEGYPIAFRDGVPSRIRYKVQTDDRGALAWILTCCGGEVYIVLYWAGEQKKSRRSPAAFPHKGAQPI